MTTTSSTFIALFRSINVGGRNRVPMAELPSLAGELGCENVRSYVQSGNLVFRASAEPGELARALELAVERHFRLAIPVIVRDAETWAGYLSGNPFPRLCESEPSLVMLAVSKSPPKRTAVPELQARAISGERIRQVGEILWIHYAGGAGKSKVSPGLLDRAVGSAVTTRNWRTACELAKLAESGMP